MAIKVYSKKGNTNYKEKRYIAKLEKAIEEKIAKDPNFAQSFKPANNFDELESMYHEYVPETIEFEETEKNEQETLQQSKPEQMPGTETQTQSTTEQPFIDPFNREEPIVRDYVMNDGFKENEDAGPKKTSFGEPNSFKESFDMNNGEEPKGKSQGNSQSNQNNQSAPKQQPLNPSFGEMDNGKKKRSTKRFAKYIVDAVCMLSEKGFVWWTTKDINDSKLAIYEINKEIDLSILLTMENGQELPVKAFFQSQCMQAETLAKFGKEQKEDLADALAEVLLEKGVAPSPMQELGLIAFSMFGEKILMAVQMNAQTNNVLEQLRALKQSEPEQEKQTQRPYREPAHENNTAQTTEESKTVTTQDDDDGSTEETGLKLNEGE